MPYTCAFVEELFRFRTIVPLTLIHKTDENAQLAEWIIPKGTSVSRIYSYGEQYQRNLEQIF